MGSPERVTGVSSDHEGNLGRRKVAESYSGPLREVKAKFPPCGSGRQGPRGMPSRRLSQEEQGSIVPHNSVAHFSLRCTLSNGIDRKIFEFNHRPEVANGQGCESSRSDYRAPFLVNEIEN